MPSDPNIEQLHKLVAEYRAAAGKAQTARLKVDAYIQELKKLGYSYPMLARESGFAQGTIQLIVAKEN